MRDWMKRDPIVISRGRNAVLDDVNGKRYTDANSYIWTHLHRHNRPAINAAVRRQLTQIAHPSALGLANNPASLLAERLVRLAPRPASTGPKSATRLEKVFFSDDGSTAMEVALKLSYQFQRRAGMRRP